MASTDPRDAPPIDALSIGDLRAALELSDAADWNQNESDWRTMLSLGQGWCIRERDPPGRDRLLATTIVLPYSGGFAWLSMVLVRREFQRRGYAAMLLRKAIGELTRRGLMPILDATPAGHPVYLKEGFIDTWRFGRYRRESAAGAQPARPAHPAAAGARPLHDGDWPAVLALDLPAFGADRSALLRSLAARAPQCAWVIERWDRVAGFVLGRDGRQAAQVGPLIAADAHDARLLLDCALRGISGPVYVDLTERHQALVPGLEADGFRFQRSFIRMVRQATDTAGSTGAAAPAAAPGDPARVVLVAGPELG